MTILKQLYEFTGKGNHVFPSSRGDSRPISNSTINTAIKALGFDDMVGHGWRTVFSSFLNEAGFNPDAIERQLSHLERNAVRGAYNRSDYWDIRVKMMQFWADLLDDLRKAQ